MRVLRKMLLCLLRKNPFTDLFGNFLKHVRSEIPRELRISQVFTQFPFGELRRQRRYGGAETLARPSVPRGLRVRCTLARPRRSLGLSNSIFTVPLLAVAPPKFLAFGSELRKNAVVKRNSEASPFFNFSVVAPIHGEASSFTRIYLNEGLGGRQNDVRIPSRSC